MKTKNFIERAKEVHGDKYNYSKVNYINAHTKVCIICPEHGEFLQTPHNHLKGSGCPKCYLENKKGNREYREKFIEKSKNIHRDKYDYSSVSYVNNRTLVDIICPTHGIFKQTPSNHIAGCGCPKCGIENRLKSHILTTEEFIKKAKLVHGDKYDYSKVEYINNQTPVTIICKTHGEFKQAPHEHLDGCGCQKCACIISSLENELFEYIRQRNDNIIHNTRNIIPPYELDIYIPSKKVAIEYNGLYWHSEKCGKNKEYHVNKLKMCQDKGIKLIQIFEDEYINNKDLVLTKIDHILHEQNNLTKIPGRKCIIKEIKTTESRNFLTKYHIQGFSKSSVYLGAFYKDQIIGVMSFRKENKDKNGWELTRFASNYNYICQGVGGKLFSYFIKNYNPEKIKSFADRRWTIDENNNIYIKLGFKFDKYTRPDYSYVINNTKRIHKFNFRKQILSKKYNLPLTMTENEMVEKIGVYKIWNCGLIKYIWNKKREV